MKAFARAIGACWRGLLWVAFPPLGWYRSRQAQRRRRHRELVAASRECPHPIAGRPVRRVVD